MKMKLSRSLSTSLLAALALAGLAVPQATATNLTWIGGTDAKWGDEGSKKKPYVWQNAKGNGANWTDGDNAIFSQTGGEVTLAPRITKTAVVAGTITVSADGYWLGIKCKDTQTTSLTADELVLTGACQTFTLTHSGTDSGETLKAAPVTIGKVTINSSGAVTLKLDKDAPFSTGSLEVAAGTTLTMAKAEAKQDSGASGETTVTGGSLTAETINAKGDLVIGSAMEVEFDGGSLVSTIKNSGNLTLKGDYEVTGTSLDSTKGAEYNTGLDGGETDGGNYFAGAKHADNTKLVDGGNVTIGQGATVTYNGVKQSLDSTGSFLDTTTAKSADYTTFFMNEEGSELSLSDIMLASSGLLQTVKMSEGELTVDTDLKNLVVIGGTVNIGEGAKVESMDVTGDAEIKGKVDPAVVGIAPQATVTFDDGIDTQDGVKFSAAEGQGSVRVTNTNPEGGDRIQYSIGESAALVRAYMLEATADMQQATTVENQLEVSVVENNSSKGLTLNGGTTGLQKIRANTGDIVFSNMDAKLELEELSIANGKNVGMYTGGVVDASHEATVSISGVLSAEGGTLHANLVMMDNSTLILGGGRLTLGSGLQFGTNILLDAATMEEMDRLAVGETYNFITPAEGTQITGDFDGKWFGEIFSRESATVEGGTPYELKGDYMVRYDNASGQVGFYKTSNVPEPTTGTLGLLALCALAARRRKH